MKKIVPLFLLSAIFVSAESSSWTPKIDLGDLYPSVIISTATITRPKTQSQDYFGDTMGQIGVYVVAPEDNCPFEVQISSGKFIRASSINGVLPKQGQTYRIYPEIDYDYDALYKTIEPIPETIDFKVSLNGQVTEARKTIQVSSVQDCVTSCINDDGQMQVTSFLFASYVNENSPIVDKILQAALNYNLVSSFSGYQGDENSVYNEIFSIWNVLQRQGIKYSSITTPSTTNRRVFTQHVRSLEDSISNQQANCVDGSVMFASVFRKIGLKPFLVLKPGHCFLGVYLDEAASKPLIIETTMIGNADLKKPSLDRMLNSLNSGRKNNLSWSSFEAAISYGANEYNDAIIHIQNNEPNWYIIPIDKCRQAGIQPLKTKN